MGPVEFSRAAGEVLRSDVVLALPPVEYVAFERALLRAGTDADLPRADRVLFSAAQHGLSEAYAERLHPRNRLGRWRDVPKFILAPIGAPGSGKGTIGKLLAKHYGVPHVSAGDMLRAVPRDSELGREVFPLIERGNLVPDHLIAGMVADRMAKPDVRGGVVLDGFPRSQTQADFLDQSGAPVTYVELAVDKALAVERLLKRAEIEGRSDDTPDVIAHRFDVHAREVEPILDRLRADGRLVTVPVGEDPAEENAARARRRIEAAGGPFKPQADVDGSSRENVVETPPKASEMTHADQEALLASLPDGVRLHNLEKATAYGRRVVAVHLHDLRLIPKQTWDRLRGFGVTWDVGIGGVPDFPGLAYLAKDKPRGWGGGWTWKNVAGAYMQRDARVILGTGEHGTKSLALHETGHAISRTTDALDSKELVAHHKRLYPKLDSYEKQRGYGGAGNSEGRDELFATALEYLLKVGREKTVKRYDEEFVSWFEGWLGL